MTTPLARRLDALERLLSAPDETVELFGCILARQRFNEILKAAQGTTIEPRTND